MALCTAGVLFTKQCVIAISNREQMFIRAMQSALTYEYLLTKVLQKHLESSLTNAEMTH